MFRASFAFAAVLLTVTSCALTPEALIDLIGGQVSPSEDSVYDILAAFDAPAVDAAAVRVVVENQTARDANVRVTMRVAGVQVHYSVRTIAASGASALIGPDRADSVLVEAKYVDEPVSLPIQTFFLGTDFAAGGTIRVVLTDEPQEPEQPGQPPPPTPPDLTIAIEGRDVNLRINAGNETSFDVVTSGAGPSAVVDAFADPDSDPDNGNELLIVANRPAADRVSVTWNTGNVAPGQYTLYAGLTDGERIARSAPAPGQIWINAQPMLVFDSPIDGLLVMRGQPFIISWAAQDDDDNAEITVFLDRDTTLDGSEQILRDGIFEDDIEDRELIVDTTNLELGTYFVGGRITDGLTTNIVYASQVCITNRLVGRLRPSDPLFGLDDLTIVHGVSNNVALGMHLDASRDVNGDGLTELLLSDPAALEENAGEFTVGEAYYHTSDTWPEQLDTSQLMLRIVGEGTDTAVGARVALLPPIHPGSEGNLLIGAPQFETGEGQETGGRAYVVNIAEVDDSDTLYLDDFGGSAGGTITGPYDHSAQLGLEATPVGDINGDGTTDYALGAPNYDPFAAASGNSTGLVALLAGGQLPDYVSFYDIGCGFPGALAIGSEVNGLAGTAVVALGDLDGDTYDDFAISAPGASPAGRLIAGAVYIIYGPIELPDDCYGSGFSLDQVGNDVRGHVLIGEADSSQAGQALAAGDFDADGSMDLLIGAPGYDGNRGRVYLIYDVDALTDDVQTIPLEQIGSGIPGVVFDGIAPGDYTGWSLANAGDFDHDGAEDVLIGAPPAESQRGAAFLVYGGQGLSGHLSLTRIGTCGFAGFQLVGEPTDDWLGIAVSGGDLNGDGPSDVVIGAPGTELTTGRAYILFGGTWPNRHGDPGSTDDDGPRGPPDVDPFPPP